MDEHRSTTAWMALAASVGAHALLVALWLHGPSRPTRTAASAGQPRAAFTVRLYAAATPSATAPVLAPPRVSPRRPQRVKAPSTSAAAAPQQVAPPPSPEAAAPAPAAAAQFAGLFGPLLSRPLGRSGWGRSSTVSPDPAPPPEQARQALRASLLGRLSDLADRLTANGQDLRCHIAVDSGLHLAEVQCADPADRGAPWGALQGLLVAGSVQPGSASLCFSLSGPRVAAAVCGDDPAAANP
jgi:hypothetical protein